MPRDRRAYYQENKEKRAAYSRAWRERNPEKALASSRASHAKNRDYPKKRYAANREKLKLESLEWARLNPEKANERSRKWRLANPVKALSSTTKWRTNNPEIYRKIVRIQQAARRACMPKWADRAAIKSIYDNCPPGYQVDHIIPIKGKSVCGLHVEYNLQYLTASQNFKKSNHFEHGSEPAIHASA